MICTHGKTDEEIIVEQLLRVRVLLNRLSGSRLQVTCLREMLGGVGTVVTYASEEGAKRVLLAFGIREEVIGAKMEMLREIEPKEPVNVGEYAISGEILSANGFTAV